MGGIAEVFGRKELQKEGSGSWRRRREEDRAGGSVYRDEQR